MKFFVDARRDPGRGARPRKDTDGGRDGRRVGRAVDLGNRRPIRVPGRLRARPERRAVVDRVDGRAGEEIHPTREVHVDDARAGRVDREKEIAELEHVLSAALDGTREHSRQRRPCHPSAPARRPRRRSARCRLRRRAHRRARGAAGRPTAPPVAAPETPPEPVPPGATVPLTTTRRSDAAGRPTPPHARDAALRVASAVRRSSSSRGLGSFAEHASASASIDANDPQEPRPARAVKSRRSWPFGYHPSPLAATGNPGNSALSEAFVDAGEAVAVVRAGGR